MDVDIEQLVNEIGRTEEALLRGRGNDLEIRKEDLKKMKQVWVSERMAPEVLMYEQELVDVLKERIQEQTAYIEEKSINMEESTEPDIKIRLLVVETEVERIKFLIRGYIRCRLAKIDKYAVYLLKNVDELAKLCVAEKEYLQRHFQMQSRLYGNQFLNMMPRNLQTLDDTVGGVSMIEEPDMDKTVCVYVKEAVYEPIIVGRDELDLEEHNVYALRYRAIAQYVKEGKVMMI